LIPRPIRDFFGCPIALTIPRLYSRTPVPYADLFAVDDFFVLIIRCHFQNAAPLIHFAQCRPHFTIVPDAAIAFESVIPPFSIRIFTRPFIPLDVGLALDLPLSIPIIPEWLLLPWFDPALSSQLIWTRTA
jgi:hypothetical protein